MTQTQPVADTKTYQLPSGFVEKDGKVEDNRYFFTRMLPYATTLESVQNDFNAAKPVTAPEGLLRRAYNGVCSTINGIMQAIKNLFAKFFGLFSFGKKEEASNPETKKQA